MRAFYATHTFNTLFLCLFHMIFDLIFFFLWNLYDDKNYGVFRFYCLDKIVNEWLKTYLDKMKEERGRVTFSYFH